MREPARVLMGEMEFLGWLGQAQPGQAIVYHRGFLAVDRRWSAHPDLGVTSNLPTEDRVWSGKPLVDRPTLQITAPATIPANGIVKARIGLRDHRNKALARACEVHLETTGGQLGRSRLPLDAGKGSFAVSASGLEPGERFKIKAGFRHYSGVAEHWFEVTA